MKKLKYLLAVFLLVLSAGAGAVYYYFFWYNGSMVPAFEEDGLKLVVEGELAVSDKNPKIVNDEILLPLDIVKKYFDPNIWWDEKLGKVTVTTGDKVIRMNTDNLTAVVNNKPMELKLPVTEERGVVYIPIGFLKDLYRIDINYIKDANVIVIDYRDSAKQYAEPVEANAAVRKGTARRYPIVDMVNTAGNGAKAGLMRVFGESGGWYRVRTASGAIGYIEKRYVSVKEVEPQIDPGQNTAKADVWKPEKGKINLIWDSIESKPDVSKLSKLDGLDIISPTWFQIADETGKLINRADPAYVEWAHKNGYKVWALFANDFKNIEMTKSFLNNTDSRDNAIRQILAYAALYKLDGINIDFEYIYKEDKNALTQFVREITPLLREQGLIVSIDVTVYDQTSDTYSLCFDRKALGEVVDYVMLMAYDQYWSTSPKAGSVAQISWVESKLKQVLEMVPREKLLLGLPFYTRLWKEETDKDGKIKATSKYMSMDEAKKNVKENNAAVTWDEASGQFYAEYKKDEATYKLWIEDENSINLKASLVQKYNLAGAASWCKNGETQAVWNAVNKNIKGYTDYQQWTVENDIKKFVFNN